MSDTSMKPYLITVAYDGSDFSGWQEQADKPTIAGVLQDTFHRVFGHEIKTVGASRTDAGVHALGQVARFYTHRPLNPEKMQRVWNNSLPAAISITNLSLCPSGFHPQHNVAHKTYRYYLANHRPNPFMSRYVTWWPYQIDLEVLTQALCLFEGTHDFTHFCTGIPSKSSVCTILECSVTYQENKGLYCIQVRGNRFLYHMVRRIVGAALVASDERGRVHQEDIKKLLLCKKIQVTLPTAAAQGLELHRITYAK